MIIRPNEVKMKVRYLRIEYIDAVRHRSRNNTKSLFQMRQLLYKLNDKFLIRIAKKLEDVRYCRLFIEAQFSCLDSNFCLQKIHLESPPPSMVFGNGSWERYESYIQEGLKT